MDRVEDRVEDRRDPPPVRCLGDAQQRREVARLGRNEDRRCGGVGCEIERVLGQAEHEVGSRPRAARELVGRSRVHADAEPGRFQLPDRILEMPERRIRQAAEIDHVGARLPHRASAGQDGIDRERRCIDDLGEDADVVARQVEAAALAEIGRQVLELVRTALERQAERGGQMVEVGTAPPRHEDAIRRHGPRQASRDDGFGHQRGDLHADVEDGPVEAGIAQARQDLLEAGSRQMPRQEQDMLTHALVLRFRISHHFAAFSERNSKSKSTSNINGFQCGLWI